MRSQMLVAFLAGAAFFTALPLLLDLPFVLLQAEGVPIFLAGMAGLAAAGAALRLVAGDRQAWALVLACVIAGAILSTLGVLILEDEGWGGDFLLVALMQPVFNFAYLYVPAAVGAWLAGMARKRFERPRRD